MVGKEDRWGVFECYLVLVRCNLDSGCRIHDTGCSRMWLHSWYMEVRRCKGAEAWRCRGAEVNGYLGAWVAPIVGHDRHVPKGWQSQMFVLPYQGTVRLENLTVQKN